MSKIPNYPFNTFSIILRRFNAMIRVMEVVSPLSRSLCVVLVMDATTVLVFNVFIADQIKLKRKIKDIRHGASQVRHNYCRTDHT